MDKFWEKALKIGAYYSDLNDHNRKVYATLAREQYVYLSIQDLLSELRKLPPACNIYYDSLPDVQQGKQRIDSMYFENAHPYFFSRYTVASSVHYLKKSKIALITAGVHKAELMNETLLVEQLDHVKESDGGIQACDMIEYLENLDDTLLDRPVALQHIESGDFLSEEVISYAEFKDRGDKGHLVRSKAYGMQALNFAFTIRATEH